MKKILLALGLFCAITLSAQNDKFVELEDNIKVASRKMIISDTLSFDVICYDDDQFVIEISDLRNALKSEFKHTRKSITFVLTNNKRITYKSDIGYMFNIDLNEFDKPLKQIIYNNDYAKQYIEFDVKDKDNTTFFVSLLKSFKTKNYDKF